MLESAEEFAPFLKLDTGVVFSLRRDLMIEEAERLDGHHRPPPRNRSRLWPHPHPRRFLSRSVLRGEGLGLR